MRSTCCHGAEKHKSYSSYLMSKLQATSAILEQKEAREAQRWCSASTTDESLPNQRPSYSVEVERWALVVDMHGTIVADGPGARQIKYWFGGDLMEKGLRSGCKRKEWNRSISFVFGDYQHRVSLYPESSRVCITIAIIQIAHLTFHS